MSNNITNLLTYYLHIAILFTYCDISYNKGFQSYHFFTICVYFTICECIFTICECIFTICECILPYVSVFLPYVSVFYHLQVYFYHL